MKAAPAGIAGYGADAIQNLTRSHSDGAPELED